MVDTGLVDMKVLEVQNLKKTYSKRRHPVEALKGVSFSVESGTTVGLVGPNGAGKTTLIKIMVGFLRKDEGKVLVRTSKPLGYVQEVPTFFDISIYDNLKYIADVSNAPRKRIDELLDKFGLADKKKQSPKDLSKGQLKRFAIIRSILHNPDILIMDEPFSGLDPSMAIGIRRIIESLRKEGKTLFISSHNLLYLTPISDRVIFMSNGEILEDYVPKESINLRITFKGKISDRWREYVENDGVMVIETKKDEIPHIIKALVNEGIEIYEARIEGLDTIYERLYKGRLE